MTECAPERFEFAIGGSREMVAEFNGGTITSDGGGVLLQETDRKLTLLARFSRCFLDKRNPLFVQHTVEQIIRQRVYGSKAVTL